MPLGGNWVYRSVDSTEDAVDFMLSANPDRIAAKHVLMLALHRTGRCPGLITMYGHPPPATSIPGLTQSGQLGRRSSVH
jgi:transposase-like protein